MTVREERSSHEERAYDDNTSGVYFLANDAVIDLTIAFLNSFRRHNPALPLCLIPFDSNTAMVESLSVRYGFCVFTDRRILALCDEIGRSLHSKIVGHYRKLAAWHGAYKRFIYIDVDTVVLSDVRFVFDYLSMLGTVTSHSDLPGLRQFVWTEDIQSADLLTNRQIAFSANTGFLASKQGILDLMELRARIGEAQKLLPYMVPQCAEQSYLNYAIVTSGFPYTSLLTIHRIMEDDELPLERWAGIRIGLVKRGYIKFPGLKRVLLLHWAGQCQPTALDRWLDRWSDKLHLRRPKAPLRRFMPYKRLWRYYRNCPAGGP